MDSFYGGHQGTPFIIKHAFPSVDIMKTEFVKGIDCKSVWFGEYCIIDTANKNDPDNGKIFRRGTEYMDDGDAVYIGQIVGPAGPAPIVEAKTAGEVEAAIKNNDLNKEYQVYPSANGIYNDDNVWKSKSDPLPIKTELTVENGGIVSGKDNPSIKFAWCNIKYRPEDSGYSSEQSNRVLIGFEIPYVVFKAQAELKSPYDESGKYQTDETVDIAVKPVVDSETQKENPFYQEFTLPVYKGVPGINYSDFQVVYIRPGDSFYTPNDIEYHGGDNPYLTIKGEAEKITPASNSTVRFYGYVVRISAYDTYNDPHAMEEIAQTADEHKDFYIKAVDTTDFTPEKLDKYGIQKGRIRSIWLYLGQKVESGKGSVAIVDKNTYSDKTAEIWSQLTGVDNAVVVTYKRNDTDITPLNKSKKWWETGFDNSNIFHGGGSG